MMAEFNDLGIGDRDERIDTLRHLSGRADINSSKDLTKTEASVVIDQLAAMPRGAE
jgi:hypothetical protein